MILFEGTDTRRFLREFLTPGDRHIPGRGKQEAAPAARGENGVRREWGRRGEPRNWLQHPLGAAGASPSQCVRAARALGHPSLEPKCRAENGVLLDMRDT